MAITYLLVDPDFVEEIPAYPDRNDGFIFEHLKEYCALFDPLPAITVSVHGQRLVVERGHHYLRIAKELRRRTLRAGIVGEDFTGIVGVLSTIPNVELEDEMAESIIDGWHVFFLISPPSSADLQALKEHFDEFLKTSLPRFVGNHRPERSDWRANPETGFVAIKFPTPLTSHEWALQFRQQFRYLPNGMRFISYQGRRIE